MASSAAVQARLLRWATLSGRVRSCPTPEKASPVPLSPPSGTGPDTGGVPAPPPVLFWRSLSGPTPSSNQAVMELIAIDVNPIPDVAIVGTVIAADGVRTRYARWRASVRPVLGTICLLPGLGEAIEKY